HAAAVHDRHVIQERAVAVGCRSQPLEEIRELDRVVRVHARQLRDLHGIVLVVRRRMMSLVEADLWVAAAAQLTAHHERDDSRELSGRSYPEIGDRKSTRLKSSHVAISYAVF